MLIAQGALFHLLTLLAFSVTFLAFSILITEQGLGFLSLLLMGVILLTSKAVGVDFYPGGFQAIHGKIVLAKFRLPTEITLYILGSCVQEALT